MEKRFFGKRIYINDAAEMAATFQSIAKADEMSAEVLFQNEQYNQAVFFLIQSMEKYVKYLICEKMNVFLPWCAERLKHSGHSIDDAIKLFVEIKAENDEIIQAQLNQQIQNILRHIRFTGIYNAIRYPFYHDRNGKQHYTVLKMSRSDYLDIKGMFDRLKVYLDQLAKEERF